MTRRRRGFSLLELVLVLVIAGIVAALAIPNLHFSETDRAWYAEQVKAGIRYAQRQAVAQRRLVFVRFDADRVRLCYDAGCTTALVQVTTGQPYALHAPNGVVLDAGVFSFDALGQPSAGLVLGVAGHPITVNAVSGYVQ